MTSKILSGRDTGIRDSGGTGVAGAPTVLHNISLPPLRVAFIES